MYIGDARHVSDSGTLSRARTVTSGMRDDEANLTRPALKRGGRDM